MTSLASFETHGIMKCKYLGHARKLFVDLTAVTTYSVDNLIQFSLRQSLSPRNIFDDRRDTTLSISFVMLVSFHSSKVLVCVKRM